MMHQCTGTAVQYDETPVVVAVSANRILWQVTMDITHTSMC